MPCNRLLGQTAVNALAGDPLFSGSATAEMLRDRPLGFVDIGGRGGVHALVHPVAELTEVLLFEPDVDACRALDEEFAQGSPFAGISVRPTGLMDRDGTAPLRIYEAPTNNSCLRTNAAMVDRYAMDKFRQVGEEEIRVTTLDAILADRTTASRNGAEFLKIDTQGTEFEIIAGGRETIARSTVCVVVEVSFCEIYEGQKLFADVDAALRDLGFSFYGFMSFHCRSRGRLDKRSQVGVERPTQADAVYFKDPLTHPSGVVDLGERQCRAMFVCAILLAYYDFALELAAKTFAVGEELKDVEALIRSVSALPPEQGEAAVAELAKAVRADPGDANILVGDFVDRRRGFWNYEDVLGTPT